MKIDVSEERRIVEAVLEAFALGHPLLDRYRGGERTETLLHELGREARAATPTHGRAEGVRWTVRAVERLLYIDVWHSLLGAQGQTELASEARSAARLALAWVL